MPNGTYGGVRGGLNSPYSIELQLKWYHIITMHGRKRQDNGSTIQHNYNLL